MSAPIYLDYNATAPLRPQAFAAMQQILLHPSNPSSVHRFGREAKKHLEAARKLIAEAISAWPNEVLFTASGTEANVTALRGTGRPVIAAATEHSSVLKSAQHTIPVDSSGIVDFTALESALKASPGALVSVMLANNETGVIQPIPELASLCHAHGALLHCDAVQALGKIPVDLGTLNADLLSLSAHKIGGPVGAAALVVRRDLPLAPLLPGGGQELNRRAGTENLAAIAGFAAALAAASPSEMKDQQSWRDAAEAELKASGAILFGAGGKRLPNTSCLAMPNVTGEVQLMDLDLRGIAVSTGSACSSGRILASHVLLAMGVERSLAGSAIRVSGGWNTTEADWLAFTSAWLALQARLAKKTGFNIPLLSKA